jgi:sulfur relay (sulfurtransferase) DsrC/TusE family protein
MSQPSWDELRYHILQVLKEYKAEFDKSDARYKLLEESIRKLEEQNINQKWINRLIILSGSIGGGVGGSAVFDFLSKTIG